MKNRVVLIVAAALVQAALPSTNDTWKVPNWNTIVTEQGAVNQWDGKVWCGHVQGMCVSSNAIYFSFHNQIVKTDWYGRPVKRVDVDRHGGDICFWKGRLYTGVARRPKAPDEKWWPCIYMYDAETLEKLKEHRFPAEGGCDGITCLDGVIYLAMGSTGRYDPERKCGRLNKYCRFDADTLEQIGEVFSEDHGDDSLCGAQNLATYGRYIYSSHYTDDEAAKTPNVIVHDKDDFHVVAKYRFGHNNGIDFVPGGRDGAVRFAWVSTPNWMNGKQKPMLPVYAIVQFVELKDGQVSDLTVYGGGYRKFIER